MSKPFTEQVSEARTRHDAEQRQFDSIHEAGVRRHPESWFIANRAAVECIWEYGGNPADLKMKILVSRVVLKTLDVAELGSVTNG